MASPLTVYSATTDNRVESYNATYATARTGSGLTISTVTNQSDYGGQTTGYYLDELLLSFDTSTVPPGATVTAVVLTMYEQYDATTDTYNVWGYTDVTVGWGAEVATSDWVAGASLGGASYPLVATCASGVGVKTFTSEAAFPAAINKGGTTWLIVAGAKLAAGTAPTTEERGYFYTGDRSPDTEGYRPKLVVTYTTAADFTGLTVKRYVG